MPVVFSSRAIVSAPSEAPPETENYYPWLGSYVIGGTPRAYDDDDFIARVSLERLTIMGVWDGWQSGRTKTMAQVMAAIAALNPDTLCALYYDPSFLRDNGSGSADREYWNKMNADNLWARVTWPSGSIAVWDAGGGGTPNIRDSAFRSYFLNWNLDWMCNANAAGLSNGSNAANSLAIHFYQDDVFASPPVSADWNKDGSTDASNSTNDALYRTDAAALLSSFIAAKGGKGGLNLSQYQANPSYVTTEYEGIASFGVLEHMMGKAFSIETFGTFEDVLEAYDRQMAILASEDRRGLFMHSSLSVTGTDDDDATAYRASRYALATCLFGDAGFFPQNPAEDVANHIDMWFDEFAVDASGNCIAYASMDPSKLGYAGERVGSRVELGNGVWMQERENVMVLVNPRGNGTQSVTTTDLGGSNVYKRMSGTQDSTTNSGAAITSSISMPARTGLILLKRSVFG